MVFRIALLILFASGLSAAAQAPSHQAWNAQLQQFVSATGSVNYQGWKAQQAGLESYLATLSQAKPSTAWSANERLAFWINAYNAFTVKLILDNYPLQSINSLNQPWDRKFITIGGKVYSLNDIEHTILRKEFKEPRIHFAVNCASVSCPPLLNQAFTAANVQTLLEQQTKKFLRDSRFNQLGANQVGLSKIFDWYGSDFLQDGSLIPFLNRYAPQPIAANAQVRFLDYNWNLNGR